MQSKLGLDFKRVEHARMLSKSIADDVQGFVVNYTTVAVERTLCRLMGIDGIDDNQVPLPNIVVDELKRKGVLNQGALFYIANTMVNTGLSPQRVAEEISNGSIDITKLPVVAKSEIDSIIKPVIEGSIDRIRARRKRREEYLGTIGVGPKPYL